MSPLFNVSSKLVVICFNSSRNQCRISLRETMSAGEPTVGVTFGNFIGEPALVVSAQATITRSARNA
jgi:hypothetical protein